MQKKELVKKLAKKNKVSEKVVSSILEGTFTEVSSSLKRGRKVMFKGFGAFVIRKKKKRMIHNVNNGKMVAISAHKAVVFVPGAPLREKVW